MTCGISAGSHVATSYRLPPKRGMLALCLCLDVVVPGGRDGRRQRWRVVQVMSTHRSIRLPSSSWAERRVLGHIHSSDAWFQPEHHAVHTSLSTPISQPPPHLAPPPAPRQQSSQSDAILLRLRTLADIVGLRRAADSLHGLRRGSADIDSRPLQTPGPSPLGFNSDFEAEGIYSLSDLVTTCHEFERDDDCLEGATSERRKG